MLKADLLAACAAVGGEEASKQDAFHFLKGYFMYGPAREEGRKRDEKTFEAEAVFMRAKAEFDDVEKAELLKACEVFDLKGATTKREAYDRLVEYFAPCPEERRQCKPPWDNGMTEEQKTTYLKNKEAERRGADAYDAQSAKERR